MSLKSAYNLTVTTLTPLHIGNGETLEQNLDFAVFKNQTWVLNEDEVLSQLFDENGRFLTELAEQPPVQLLRPSDFQPTSRFFRYVMRGAPRARATGAQVQAQIKDVFDKPYLPGSSLKGAIRTCLFRHAFAQSKQPLRPDRLRQSRSWAGQDLERALLGKDPNHDLLRALHIADSQPVAAESLVLLNAQVFGRRSAGSPIELEAIRGDVAFFTKLTIDDYLLTSRDTQRLGFDQMREWLADLPTLINEQMRRRIRQELVFYQQRSTSRAAGFYRQLDGVMQQLPQGAFVIQVGWGGGWDSKTLGYLVPAAEREALIQRYRLAMGKREPGDAFPKSRRAVARGSAESAEPVAPLGWLLVQMS